MASINLLDKNTIDQIAAGEVVERPASVVKELVENAIDAGATAITAEISGGGIDFIRITDNGSGIVRDEVRTAFLRHSTSKLQTAEDLITVDTLGFRGEALASIASVARVELITKTRGEFTGTRFCIEGGEETLFEEVGSPEGTTFIVRELFYNTPARRKFLKTSATEAGYVNEIIERIALSHPEISFKYINKGNTVLYTTGNRNLKEVIYGVYGRDIASSLIEINGTYGGISIAGFVGKPSVSRGNRGFESYYINGRYIKSQVITKAVEEAYKPYTMQHKYPFTSFNIEVPHEVVDVNVHPAKLEVRFSDSEAIYRAVYHLIGASLSGKNLIPEIREAAKEEKQVIKAPEPFENRRRNVDDKRSIEILKTISAVMEELPLTVKSSTAGAAEQPDIGSTPGHKEMAAENIVNIQQQQAIKNDERNPLQPDNSTSENVCEEERTEYSILSVKDMQQGRLELDEKKDYRIIGQLFNTYWLVEWDNVFYIIDQHAAHEKIIYERMVKGYYEKKVISQNLTPPIIVSLSTKEENILKQHMEVLREAGFEIENFGGREYAISTVPCDLYGICGQDYFVELLDSMAELGAAGDSKIFEKLAGMSCKAAIKGNSRISQTEARALIEQLLELENPFNCPHGRPIIISMTKQEVEKKFKRIV